MKLARDYWESVFSTEDPWGYGRSQYEDWKFGLTLSLLGEETAERALELACAEGHLTARLAPLVGSLTAVDVSPTAVARAQVRCKDLKHVKFLTLDFSEADLPGRFDLILCSEVLFYFPYATLQDVAAKIADALSPGGRLLLAHGNLITDDKTRTGFDWGHPFGAKTIGEVFAALGVLSLERELRTPLFTVQSFRRAKPDDKTRAAPRVEEVALPFELELSPELERTILWGGAETTRAEAAANERASQVPVLMYHSVSDDGPAELAPYRVTPRAFREQLQTLRRRGYHSIDLETLAEAMRTRTPIPGRPIVLTFDDGYQDFYDNAWPELQRADFSATVFVVTDRVGGVADWDKPNDAPLPLMSWETLRTLQDAGVTIASHSAAHKDLSTLSPAEVRAEGQKSRQALSDRLGQDVRVIAFPWGRSTPAAAEALRRVGYEVAVTTWGGLCNFDSDLMNLPRIEVLGDDDGAAFARRIRGEGPELAVQPPPTAEPPTSGRAPTRMMRKPIDPRLARSFALRLDALVGEFVRLQSQLLRELEAPMSLQRRLTEMFCAPLTGSTRRKLAWGDLISPGVRIAFDEGLEIELTVEAKSDHTSSPEACLNTLRFDLTGAGGWAWLEIDLEWGELAGVDRFQLGLYAQPTRAVTMQGGLRFPKFRATPREAIFATFELSPYSRNATVSGDLTVPDLVEFDISAKPNLILYLSADSEVSLTLHYLNVYFA